MPPKALSIIVERIPRDLTPTVYFNPFFSSTLPSTFETFMDINTSSLVLGFFQPQSQCHSSCLLSMLSCHPSRRSGPTSITVFWILFESLPAVWLCCFHACSWQCSKTSCGSALKVSFHQDHSSVRIHPVCCFELCLLSGASLFASASISPRERRTHNLRNVVPWFVKGFRWFNELFARPRADPRVRCAWFGVTQNHSLPSSLHVCVECVVSRA